MPLIRAVLFDYGMVLTGPPDPLAWRRMETTLSASDPEFHDAYWRHRHDYDLGVLSGARFWHAVASDLKRSLTAAELNTLLEADIDLWTQPNQPMIDWAAKLQSSGMTTGILSNMGDVMETGIMARCPWLANFAHHTFSHRLGIAKPDERIYQSALDAISSSADETLFIDDRIENIEAARAIGIHAIQYGTQDAFLRELQCCGFSGLPLPSFE